jgi:hypothetical protein
LYLIVLYPNLTTTSISIDVNKKLITSKILIKIFGTYGADVIEGYLKMDDKPG